jgi:hypothetical protein
MLPNQRLADYEPPGSAVAMLLNVALARVPIAWIETKQTITMRASITAYSTAVGPSSDAKKCLTFKAKFFIADSPSPAPAGKS